MERVILVGCPNVGKSAVFSRLTGTRVMTSNYPGTTIEIKKGHMEGDGWRAEVVDTPGIYSLGLASPAEQAVLRMIDDPSAGRSVLVFVINSTALERGLPFALDFLSWGIPSLLALNMIDEARHVGVAIDAMKLEEILGIPVVATCTTTGEGIVELKRRIPEARVSRFAHGDPSERGDVDAIVESVQRKAPRRHTLKDRLDDHTMNPLVGLPLALVVLFLTFQFTRLLSEGLITFLLEPLFGGIYMPLLGKAFSAIDAPFLSRLLLGTTEDPLMSFGVLTTGVYIICVAILPYLFSFYLALSFLEDSGYLPRLAISLDSFLHRFGLHGYSVVPVMLGLGCKVPAILSTRLLESRRERFVTTLLLLMVAPCMSQTAMIVSVLSPFGVRYLLLAFGTISLLALGTNLAVGRFMGGETPELLFEIPPYRMPRPSMLARKLWLRLGSFIGEAIPLIFAGVAVMGVLDGAGILESATGVFSPLFSLLGLPSSILPVLVTGFLRKDISIALLVPFHLGAAQLVISSIFLTLYLPCVSTLFLCVREMGARDTVKMVVLMLGGSYTVCLLLSRLFPLLGLYGQAF